MDLDSSVGRLRGLQRLVALLVCLLLAISLLPVGSAQAVQGEAPSQEMLVWVVTDLLDANTTALLATAELVDLDENTGPVNFSLIHSGEGWNFTSKADDAHLEPWRNISIRVYGLPSLDVQDGEPATAILSVVDPDDPPALLQVQEIMGNRSIGSLPEGPEAEEEADQLEDAHDMLDGPSEPSEKSMDAWVWYAVDATEWGYDAVTDHWPNPDHVSNKAKERGVDPDLPFGPRLPDTPNAPSFDKIAPRTTLEELIESPPDSPIEDVAFTFVGPRPPGETGAGTTKAYSGSGTDSFGTTFPYNRLAGHTAGGSDSADDGGPSIHRPSDDSGPFTFGGDPDGRSPSGMNSLEASPLPFVPVIAAVVAVGLGGGVLIGTAVTQWGSLLARWFGKIFSGLAFTKLFSRTTGPEVLKFPLRAQIHDVITKEPGITISVLAKSTGVNRSTLRDHLRTLEREGLIQSRSNGKTCHLYAKGKTAIVQKDLPRETFFYRHRSKLAQTVVAQPGLAQRQLAEMVNLPRSRVCVYARSLVEAGLVEAKRDGRYLRYFPTPKLHEMDERILSPA